MEDVSLFRNCEPSKIGSAADVGECAAGEDGWHSEDTTFLPGNSLSLIREPENPIDPSAIAVHDSSGQKLGYLMTEQSAFLARFIDSLPINVVGRVLSLRDPGDDVELASSKPEVIASVFTHPGFCSGTPADAMRYDRR
jgi:hypothetical protein